MEIFTSGGKVRSKFTDDELDSLDPDKHERLEKVIGAARAVEQVESDLRESQKSVENWARLRVDAINELQKVRPQKTFLDCWRDMRASQ